MSVFSLPVAVYFEVEIEAEDAYDADEKIRGMDNKELRKLFNRYPFPEYDIDHSGELPQEV